MSDEPSPASANGHDARGRFVPGNPGGPGNPHAGQVARLRSAMLASITPTDLQVIIARLIDMARDGDLKAVALLFSVVGKPGERDVTQMEAVASPGQSVNSDRIRAIAARIRTEREASDQPAA